jgi:DNA-binding CsgD family transcriptional regulator
VIRAEEDQALAEFMRKAAVGTPALVIEGAPGIGKTTFWMSAVEKARSNGFRVLAASPAASESVLAYASLADMLVDCDASMLASLPAPQRVALDRLLLRGDADEAATTDQRAVTAAVLSVLTALVDECPVLLAIDDLQWLDSSSRHALAFVARRLPARVGVLGTARVEDDLAAPASWLSLQDPDALRLIRMRPLSPGALHSVLTARLGQSFSRPAMISIYETSGGNPFYAIELARAAESGRISLQTPMPATLLELVRARIDGVADEAREALLAAASHGVPTVDLIARAVSRTPQQVSEWLDDAQDKGIVIIDGGRLRFTHPLLAKGVYVGASAAQRRAMHRRLAEVVDGLELRARHLALAATRGDDQTLIALDAAAESARMRGAPATAAQLLEFALNLGGDTPERRIALASDHFQAGDIGRARDLLLQTIERLEPGRLRAAALHVLSRLRLVADGYFEAAELLRQALDEVGDDYALKAELLLSLSFALMNTGQLPGAVQAVEDAAEHAERIGDSEVLGQTLAFMCGLRMIAGDGFDTTSLRRALQLGDATTSVPVQFQPSMVHALVTGWVGQLEESHRALQAVRKRCLERGEETELHYISFHAVAIAVWRGDIAEAALVADDSMERAAQLGGDMPLAIALSMRSIASAYAGRIDEARADALECIALCERGGYFRLTEWAKSVLGFLAVSVGDYENAMTVLESLVAGSDAMPRSTELLVGAFIPDAAEAMIHLGRLQDAQRLIERLECNGARLDRAWMLAVGARCRAMLLATQGDLAAAMESARTALAEHARVPMPFERARTQLLCGQLLRRQRRRDAAAAAFADALEAFERMGSSVWASRVQSELSRTKVSRQQPSTGLTPSELQVAEMAASGMRNREIAAKLFISPKTVEVNLFRIYRKLDIRSRAELGRVISERGSAGAAAGPDARAGLS